MNSAWQERFLYSMPAPHEETAEPPVGQWTIDHARHEAGRALGERSPLTEEVLDIRIISKEHVNTSQLC